MFLDPPHTPRGERSRMVWTAAHDSALRFEKLIGGSDSRNIPQLSWKDIHVDSVLGSGSFNFVYKVRASHAEDLQDGYYALKCLHPETVKHDKVYQVGANDLVLEAAIMSRLDHENIIRLHGTTTVSESCSNGGYFLLLGLLEETLQDRLNNLRRSYSMFTSNSDGGPAPILERLRSTAVGIVRAMEYLHENDIILRDLKPANVGFDAQGKVKLFDFGLARSLHDGRDNEIAGSLRYMAPETVLAYGSDKKSDVYSFGVLLWELCALQRPFQQFRKTSQFKEKVVVQHYRPPVRSMHSRSLETIIRRSWDFQPSNRPTFSSIRFMLDQAMNEIDLKVSRHSTVSAGNTPLTETHPRGWSLRRQASMPAKLPHRDDQEDATPTITNRELSSFFRRNSEAVHNKTDRTKDESASSMSRGSFIRRFSGIFNFSTNGRTSGDESSTSVSGNSCQSL